MNKTSDVLNLPYVKNFAIFHLSINCGITINCSGGLLMKMSLTIVKWVTIQFFKLQIFMTTFTTSE